MTTPHFVLLLALQPTVPSDATAGRAPSRLGLVVSRKVGGAVRRARVKRLCRECFRTWPSIVPPGVDLVVIARSGADGLSLDDVRREWLAVEGQIARRAAETLARGANATHAPAIKRR